MNMSEVNASGKTYRNFVSRVILGDPVDILTVMVTYVNLKVTVTRSS